MSGEGIEPTPAAATVEGEDVVAELRRRIDRLEAAPLADHPDELESVHRRLVDELDRLSRTAPAPGS